MWPRFQNQVIRRIRTARNTQRRSIKLHKRGISQGLQQRLQENITGTALRLQFQFQQLQEILQQQVRHPRKRFGFGCCGKRFQRF